MQQKVAEMHARRQSQTQQAAINQAQIAGSSSEPNQAGLQHLSNPTQVSQLPQQTPQIGLNLSNNITPQINPGQPSLPMLEGLQHNPDQPQLSDLDKQKILVLAQNLMQQSTVEQKQQMLQIMQSQTPPQRLKQMHAEGQNPLVMLFQQEATKRFVIARQYQMQQKQGIPSTIDHPTGSNAESDGSKPSSVSNDDKQMAQQHHPNQPNGINHSRQRLRHWQLDAKSLAGIVNKDTISKDNTISEEAQEAILLANMARKINRMMY